MIKKLATVGAAGSLLLASALPVLADGHRHGGPHFGFRNVIWNSNGGIVTNEVGASANTGGNSIDPRENNGDNHDEDHGKKEVKNSRIKTGNAGAVAEVTTALNSNVNDPCGCRGNLIVNRNRGMVTNGVFASANTGRNKIDARDKVENSSIVTGDALAVSTVTNVVNTNVNF